MLAKGGLDTSAVDFWIARMNCKVVIEVMFIDFDSWHVVLLCMSSILNLYTQRRNSFSKPESVDTVTDIVVLPFSYVMMSVCR